MQVNDGRRPPRRRTPPPPEANIGPPRRTRRQPRETPDLGVCGLLHRLDLLFDWLESGGEHSSGQLGYVVAIADGGFDALLDQLLLQLHELHRVLNGGKPLNRSGQILGVLCRQILIRLGQLLNSCFRGAAAFGRRLGAASHDRLCGFAALG